MKVRLGWLDVVALVLGACVLGENLVLALNGSAWGIAMCASLVASMAALLYSRLVRKGGV